MAVRLVHLLDHHASGGSGEAASGEDHVLTGVAADLAELVHDANLAVAVARTAWEMAEPVQRDAAWAWLQACVAHRDLLLHLAREGLPVPIAPVAKPHRGPEWTGT